MSNPSTAALAAIKGAALTPQEDNLHGLLRRMEPEIERALPRAIGADRFVRLVLTEIRRKPELLACKPETVLGAMMLVAQLGLEPGPLGHAYLIPYKSECQFVLGYKGMIELASRSGRLRSIIARPVFEGDDFSYSYGMTDRLHHVPAPPSDRGVSILSSGLARFASPSGSTLHTMYPEEIEKYRLRSPMGKLNKGMWATDPLAAALKTVIRRMQPWLPQSPAMARALEVDESSVILDDEADVIEVQP